jgi:NhaP-type Na+/H+ or K+/H+ antiporter
MCTTVLLSVILHGITLEPIARWFQRHPQPQAGPTEAGPAR